MKQLRLFNRKQIHSNLTREDWIKINRLIRSNTTENLSIAFYIMQSDGCGTVGILKHILSVLFRSFEDAWNDFEENGTMFYVKPISPDIFNIYIYVSGQDLFFADNVSAEIDIKNDLPNVDFKTFKRNVLELFQRTMKQKIHLFFK